MPAMSSMKQRGCRRCCWRSRRRNPSPSVLRLGRSWTVISAQCVLEVTARQSLVLVRSAVRHPRIVLGRSRSNLERAVLVGKERAIGRGQRVRTTGGAEVRIERASLCHAASACLGRASHESQDRPRYLFLGLLKPFTAGWRMTRLGHPSTRCAQSAATL